MQQRKSFLFILSFIVLTGVFVPSSIKAADEDQDRKTMMEIAHGLVCLCGCGNQILATCTCGEAQSERNYILSLVKMGKTTEEIKASMVKKKGPQVLAAPEKKGFNWVLWVVVPYILPVVAVIMVGYLLVGWTRKKPELPPQTAGQENASVERDEYLKKLEKELDDFS